jgi:hypothetical protein
MQLSVNPKIVTFAGTGNERSQSRTRKEQVEDAATATGGVGAGVAATRGGAMKFFNTAKKLDTATALASSATKAAEVPIKQTNSLWNAFRLNCKGISTQIANWAEGTNMPNFMKYLFKGGLGKIIGRGAAVFVFITGLGEVVRTVSNHLYKAGATFNSVNQ